MRKESQKQTKEFLQDIISDVSHQIKTPLSALKMYHEIISSHKGEAETVANFSEKSQREIKRMENVIYTLLKLARLDAGIIQMEKAEENVSALMQDVLERFETWAEQDHKEITLSGKDDISLNCDALWMSEAIGNIVKNALEHTQPGGHISVQWTQSPLLTQIVITDDGKGIHQEDLYNIFKRFYRSRFSSDVHGIGLGLPLAKSIVEAHGGTISVTSTLNVGTTFTLNFFSLTNE
jgi:signal transduction histidine kinase